MRRPDNNTKRPRGSLLARVADKIGDYVSHDPLRGAAPSSHDDNTIISKTPPPAPTIYEIPIGVRLDGSVAKMKLYEKHTLIAGASGSGKSYLANRVLAQIVRIPKDQRIIVGIDLKQSEIAKWHGGGCLDAAAISYDYAALLLGNVRAEMDRRNNLVWSNPQIYRDSKIHPGKEFPLIVVYIDELAMIGLPQKGASKEEEDLRKLAYDHFSKLLFLARSAGIIVIACIQRSDASIIDGFTKQNFQQMIAGRVATRTDAEVIFGRDVAQVAKAWELENKWFWANFEGGAPFLFKAAGEAGDADLWRVIEDPETTIPEDRGKWLYDPMFGKGKGTAAGTPGRHKGKSKQDTAGEETEKKTTAEPKKTTTTTKKTTAKTAPKKTTPKKETAPKKQKGRPKTIAGDPDIADTFGAGLNFDF